MDILKECAELAKKHEGLYTLKDDGLVYAYHDPVGYPTIGYGNPAINGEVWRFVTV